LADSQKLVAVVGWHVVATALHIVAWCVVANDTMLDEPVSVQLVGVPVRLATEAVPARVTVIVNGEVVVRVTVEDPKLSAVGIVAPATTSFATV
jgi:hypothetical protein